MRDGLLASMQESIGPGSGVRLVYVSGVSGVGKTTLIDEALRREGFGERKEAFFFSRPSETPDLKSSRSKKKSEPALQDVVSQFKNYTVLRASELNALLSAILDETAEPARGSVRWGIGLYEGDDEYRDLKESTQRVYSQSLVRISARFGRWPIKGIDYRNAKQFYRDERAPQRAGEKERLGQANNTLRVARLVWEYFIREEHAAGNPFRKVRLSSLPSRKALWTRSQVDSFIAAADRLACPEIGTAVLLAFELCQRQGDILGADRRKPHHDQAEQDGCAGLDPSR